MTSTHISFLLLIAFSCWRDREALRGGGALSRWTFYSVIAVSLGILVYVTWAARLFYPTVWLSRLLGPLLPFHNL